MKKSSQSPNRSYKRSKLSPGTDSDRIITLTQKKVKARLFDKINVKNKEAYNKLKFNDDSQEEKIFSNHSGSEASDTLFIDTENSKKRKRGKKENQDIQREDIFEKAKDVTIISESACSSDLSYHQSFSTSLLDLFKLGRIQGDGNCLFRAQCKLAFGDDSFHLVVRQTVCYYMIHNRDRFEQYMEEDTTIDQYISKMLLNGECGGHAEIVAFSEIYDVQIQVFDSLAAQQPIERITTAEGGLTLSLLFSGDHYDWLIPKFEGDQEPEINHIVKKEDLENKKPADLKQIIRENKFPNDYSTKYTDETLRSILNYLKDGKYPESIENLRKSKNKIVLSNESTRKQQQNCCKLNLTMLKDIFRLLVKKKNQG